MRISVADIIESMEVHILPLSVHNNEICRIYKLLMTFKHHEFVSLEDCEDTLMLAFLRGLEDAIENHMGLLSKISGIKNFKSNLRSQENEMDEDASLTSRMEKNDVNEDGDSDNDESDDIADDLGFDTQKRKQQATDEMDYEGASGDESADEEEQGMAGQSHDEVETGEDEDFIDVSKEDTSETPYDRMEMSEPKSCDKQAKSKSQKRNKSEKKLVCKDGDRCIFVEVKGQNFEAHFRFTNEPHILLAQVCPVSTLTVITLYVG